MKMTGANNPIPMFIATQTANSVAGGGGEDNVPKTGRGSYEPNFKVEFEGGEKGLEDAVAAATSGTGTIRLGHADKMPSLIEEIFVTLPNYSGSLQARNGGFLVEARIVPAPGAALHTNFSHYAPEFKVQDAKMKGKGIWKAELAKPSNTTLYERIGINLANAGWPNQNSVDGLMLYVSYLAEPVCTGGSPKLMHSINSLYASPANEGMTHQAAKDVMAAFAMALERTVNSAYACAGQHSPKMTLVLEPKQI